MSSSLLSRRNFIKYVTSTTLLYSALGRAFALEENDLIQSDNSENALAFNTQALLWGDEQVIWSDS